MARVQTTELPRPRIRHRLFTRSRDVNGPAPDSPFQGRGHVDIEEAAARTRYGRLLVQCYLALLVVLLVGPFLSWIVISQLDSASQFTKGLRDVQDFAVAMIGGLGALGGLVGLVIGRYFSRHDV